MRTLLRTIALAAMLAAPQAYAGMIGVEDTERDRVKSMDADLAPPTFCHGPSPMHTMRYDAGATMGLFGMRTRSRLPQTGFYGGAAPLDEGSGFAVFWRSPLPAPRTCPIPVSASVSI